MAVDPVEVVGLAQNSVKTYQNVANVRSSTSAFKKSAAVLVTYQTCRKAGHKAITNYQTSNNPMVDIFVFIFAVLCSVFNILAAQSKINIPVETYSTGAYNLAMMLFLASVRVIMKEVSKS